MNAPPASPAPSASRRVLGVSLRLLAAGTLLVGWLWVGGWALLVLIASYNARADVGGDGMGALAGAIWGAVFAYFWAGVAPFAALPGAIVNREGPDVVLLGVALLQAFVIYVGSLVVYVALVTYAQWQH